MALESIYARIAKHFNSVLVWSILYLLLFLLLHAIIVAMVIKTFVDRQTILVIVWSVYVILVSIPIAERICLMVLFVIARGKTVPPKLDKLYSRPKVALLYLTCDDLVPECLSLLSHQIYENLSIFVLDDSQTEYYRRLVDLSDYTVIRRADRKGFKAGNINNWLKQRGKDYDYFVILDADTILPTDFVISMLQYAEHPDNQGIAFFESRIHAWRPSNGLQQATAVQLKIASENAIRLSNRLGITMSNGHNNLCRSSHLLSVGGFDEQFIGEDHATTLNLIARGLSCQIVDVESFEITPSSLFAFKQRMRRWSRNDLQLLFHTWKDVPLVLQFRMFLHVLLHFMWFSTLLTMLMVLWSYDSSLNDITNFGRYLLEEQGYRNPQLVPILALFALSFVYLFITPVPQALTVRVRLNKYLYSSLVTLCLGFGTMFSVMHSALRSLINMKFSFEVTPKQNRADSLLDFSLDNWFLCVFVTISLAGLIHNPASIIFNWTWILPLLISPLVLYKAQQTEQN